MKYYKDKQAIVFPTGEKWRCIYKKETNFNWFAYLDGRWKKLDYSIPHISVIEITEKEAFIEVL